MKPVRRFHRVLGAVVLALWAVGCGRENPVLPGAGTRPGEPILLAVNGLAETLALVRLDSLAVVPNALLLGDYPNDVVVDPSGRRALVVNSGDNEVTVVGLEDSLRVLSRIDLGSGTNPYAAAWDGEMRAYVSLWLTNEVVRIDVSAGAILSRTEVGPRPQGLLVVGERVVVTLTNYQNAIGFGPGEVAVLDAASGAFLRRLHVGLNPQSAAVAPDGRIHVVCTGNYGLYSPPIDGWIYVLDALADSVIDSVQVGGAPVSVAMSPSGRGYLASESGGLLAYEAASLALVASADAPLIPLDGFSDVVLDAPSSRLFAANFNEDLLFVVDVSADTVLTALPLGDGPVSVALRR